MANTLSTKVKTTAGVGCLISQNLIYVILSVWITLKRNINQYNNKYKITCLSHDAVAIKPSWGIIRIFLKLNKLNK